MSYEAFNEAMCKLRQAEEEFNKKLQEAFKPIIDEINRMDKEEQQADLQAQIDETYNKGLEDARNAVLQLYKNENWYKIFGSCYNFNILTNHSMAEIIEKENQLKAEKAEKDKKEQELHVGDEVITDRDIIGIITSFGEDLVWITYRVTSKARGFDYFWVKNNDCKKTGRHFGSIPFDYNPTKDD